MLLPFNLRNVFILFFLDVSDIKIEENLNIDELKTFNIKYIDAFDV